jgi:hypothetical protein
MLIKKYNSIMEKSEEHRNKWALSLSITLSVLIFVSFAFYKGYISFGNYSAFAKKQPAREVAAVAEAMPSPIENTKETFKAAFGEIKKQYQEFTNSVSAVLVPFITGIDVYQRK